MSQYNSRLIDEDEPANSIHRIKSLLQLYASVDWDSPMVGAEEGKLVLMDEVIAALEEVQGTVANLQRDACK